MKLRQPVSCVATPPTCAHCGGVVYLARTEVNTRAATLVVFGECQAKHPYSESRPLPPHYRLAGAAAA